MNVTKTIFSKFQRPIVDRLLNSFLFWQSVGVHVVPNNFYQPVPDTSTLEDSLWQRTPELVGVRMNEARQIELLSLFAANYKREYENFPRDKTAIPHQYYINNDLFVGVDGEVLYCMIRHFKPRKIFEIGSGNSTYLSAQAILRNAEENGHACELISFEPYPNEVLQSGFPGLRQLIKTRAQEIPVHKFSELGDGDILFIDSSHVLKIGSDVQYLYLEVLPRLAKGVLVHVHDIFLPAEYPREWIMDEHRFWNEQYLLQAFLLFNDTFQVDWAASFMHVTHPDKLQAAFSSYDPKTSWPGSFWMRKIA